MMLYSGIDSFADIEDNSFSISNWLVEVLCSKNYKLKLLAEKYKSIIMQMFKENNEGLTTSQIAKRINLDFEYTHFILSYLEKEGLLRIA